MKITDQNARLYIASMNRAETLFTTQGYDWEYETLDAVKVRKPGFPFAEGGKDNFGEYVVNALEGTCDCPAFTKTGEFCKHSLAVQNVLHEEIACELLAAQHDRDMQACENELTGCDYRY